MNSRAPAATRKAGLYKMKKMKLRSQVAVITYAVAVITATLGWLSLLWWIVSKSFL